MDKFFYQDTLMGLRISDFNPGSTPVTAPEESTQILTINQPKGTLIKPHFHKPVKRETQQLQECLIVRKGKIQIDLYAPDKTVFEHITLNAGELFITISGGHSIQIIEDAEVFEIKNGPFAQDREDI